MGEGESVKIWLDVEVDPDGTLNYPSGDPILTFIDREPVTLDPDLPPGQCLYFDWNPNSYVKAPCSETHLTVCYIKKTPAVIEEKLFVDNIDDHINELGKMRLPGNINTYMKIQLKRLDQGECPDSPITSLSQALGLNQPVESLKVRQSLDIFTYTHLSNFMLNDVNSFWHLMFNGQFEDHLRVALGHARNVKMLYDGVKKAVCVFTKIITPDKDPMAIEMVITDIEQKINKTIADTSKLTKEQMKGALEQVQLALEQVKVDKPSPSTVQEMINTSFRSTILSTKQAIEAAISNPKGITEKITKKILTDVEQLVKGLKKDVAMNDQVTKLIDEALEQVNDTIFTQIQAIDLTPTKDHGFYKLSLLDLILAITSIILATIAIINSVCLCVISARRKQMDENRETYAEGFDLELTPMLGRRDNPEGDNARSSRHSSMDTAPSPEPAVRRAHFDESSYPL